jgi:predicted RNase H-like HicB family nuclease
MVKGMIFITVLSPAKSKGYSIAFPDLEGCYTEGDNLQDGCDMAEDALCLVLYDMEENKKIVPKPSDPKSIKVDSKSFVTLISCDTLEYRKFYDSKAVKKTLSIPSWLNKMAESSGINFSATLQGALKQQLHIEDRM